MSDRSGGPDWVELDRRHIWRPYTQMQTAPPALPVVRAEGVYLETADGRRILDAISSWWVNIHGHNHPRLNRALAEQAGRLAQVIFANFTHEPAARLAAALAERAPGQLPWVFYSDDGSTAVEVALKMAWQLWAHRGWTASPLTRRSPRRAASEAWRPWSSAPRAPPATSTPRAPPSPPNSSAATSSCAPSATSSTSSRPT